LYVILSEKDSDLGAFLLDSYSGLTLFFLRRFCSTLLVGLIDFLPGALDRSPKDRRFSPCLRDFLYSAIASQIELRTLSFPFRLEIIDFSSLLSAK